MSTMQRRWLLQIIPYTAASALVALTVYIYFKLLHVNQTTVAMTLIVWILVISAYWGLLGLDLYVDRIRALLQLFFPAALSYLYRV